MARDQNGPAPRPLDAKQRNAATLGDVAARAGVSISAVSRVLSNAPSARVSEATRQRIVDAASELHYRPNFAGRALKSARTQVIGLVVPDLTNALFTELMHGGEDEAAARGYTLLLGRADDVRPGGEVIGRLIGENRVDGMVVQVGDSVPTAGLGSLLESGAPIVLINSATVATLVRSSLTTQPVLVSRRNTFWHWGTNASRWPTAFRARSRPNADGSATTPRWQTRAFRCRMAMRPDWDMRRRTGGRHSNA